MEPEYVSFACSLGTEKPLKRDCIQGVTLRGGRSYLQHSPVMRAKQGNRIPTDHSM